MRCVLWIFATGVLPSIIRGNAEEVGGIPTMAYRDSEQSKFWWCIGFVELWRYVSRPMLCGTLGTTQPTSPIRAECSNSEGVNRPLGASDKAPKEAVKTFTLLR